VSQLPEVCSNDLRYRVWFILPRWFTMPSQVFVVDRYVALFLPEKDVADGDFIQRFLRNEYGLGRGLPDVRTILDVGAHAGFFSLAARGRYPAATIHAYEPNPRILPFLRVNSATAAVRIFPEAIGEKEGYVAMIDTGPSDEARTHLTDDATGAVRQVRLETAIERIGGEVDLLKLDCEGAEFQILKPAAFWNRVHSIRMEYHLYSGGTVHELMTSLAKLGFSMTRLQVHHAEAGIIWAAHA
jgi:FkbM family methyltransferase